MTDYPAYTLAVRLTLLHAFLGTAHFARCNHLHGARDLLRILHATDLFLYFLTNRHAVFSFACYRTLTICSSYNARQLVGLCCFELLDGLAQCINNIIVVGAGFVNGGKEVRVFSLHESKQRCLKVQYFVDLYIS